VVEEKRHRFFIAKGAPEEILKVCSYYEVDGLISDISEEIVERLNRSIST